ncbi:MAG: hypothetical protein U5L05_13135 [Rubrivivax sp.]|nr:hypothetical protein [Rubrivivax sp.]
MAFAYESTGIETHFTNGLDPAPRARNVFAFHRPALLAEWLQALPQPTVLTTDGAAAKQQAQAPAAMATGKKRLNGYPLAQITEP